MYSIKDGRSTGYAPTTIIRRLAPISALFSFQEMRDPEARNPVPRGRPARGRARGERSGLLAHTAKAKPRSRLRLREPQRLPRGLSREESALLLGSLRTWRDRAIAGLMLMSGLRSCEVLGLQVADIDIARRWARAALTAFWPGSCTHRWSTRNGTPRRRCAKIDQKVAQVAAELGVSEAAAVRHFDDRIVIDLAVNTANTWHAAQVADEVAGGVVVPVPAADAGQPVMGLAIAVGQMVREAYGELPASTGKPVRWPCQRRVHANTPPPSDPSRSDLPGARRELSECGRSVAACLPTTSSQLHIKTGPVLPPGRTGLGLLGDLGRTTT